jgi:organic hydroperoxide reductase OsmC/OhrA
MSVSPVSQVAHVIAKKQIALSGRRRAGCQRSPDGFARSPDRRGAEGAASWSMTTLAPVLPSAQDTETFCVNLRLLDGFAFRVDFDDARAQSLTTHQRTPAGDDIGPSPSRLLAAAVANCLASSLLHCLLKARVPVEGLEASAVTTLGRNASGRLRIERIVVLLDPRIPQEQAHRLSRCATLFEDFCTVTESVRHGIDIRVNIASI